MTDAAKLLADASNVTVKTTPLQATGSNADLWSQFMYEYGTKIGSGVYRHVTTYTLDVCNAQCQTDQATLLQSMANVSFGRYFKTTNLQAIETALDTIFAQVQSINAWFCSGLHINHSHRMRGARWVDAVVKTAAAASEDNRRLLSDWARQWGERAKGALAPVAEMVLGETAQTVIDEVWEAWQARCTKAGLAL